MEDERDPDTPDQTEPKVDRFGRLTPARLKELMGLYNFQSGYQLSIKANISRTHISEHLRGIRALGFESRKRLAEVFFQKEHREDIFS